MTTKTKKLVKAIAVVGLGWGMSYIGGKMLGRAIMMDDPKPAKSVKMSTKPAKAAATPDHGSFSGIPKTGHVSG
jgi:hypothetical protein